LTIKRYLQTEFWKRDALPLGLLLSADLLAGLAVAWKVPFQAPNPAYLCDATQFAATHRVTSVFLPIGFSGLLGWSDRLGDQAGMTALSILLSLAVIASAWIYLRTVGLSLRATFALASLLSLYPDLLLSYNKAQDTALTAVLLFVFATSLLRAVASKRFGAADVVLALTLGYAVLVRANLFLLLPLAWIVFWRFRVPKGIQRVVSQGLIVVVIYLLGTTAIHGRPFFPHNGPYNLYSGANEFTEAHIANEEDSLPAAMALHGITVADPNDGCSQQSGDPSRPDIHERRLDPLYTQFAMQFIRTYPGTMAKLVWLKFVTVMSPDLWVYSPKSSGGALKILAALAFPLWLLAFLSWPHPGGSTARLVVALMVACYIVPFLLTVSSPRFRVPLDFFLWMDLGAIVIQHWRGTSVAESPVDYHPH